VYECLSVCVSECLSVCVCVLIFVCSFSLSDDSKLPCKDLSDMLLCKQLVYQGLDLGPQVC